MKQLLNTILLIALSCIANAQAGKVIVKNESPCPVYFVLHGVPAPNCGVGQGSSVITIPANTTITYPNSASIPGFPVSPVFFISRATVLNRPTSCGSPTTYIVGEPCVPLPQHTAISSQSSICTFCMLGYADWFPAPTLGGTATLRFIIN